VLDRPVHEKSCQKANQGEKGVPSAFPLPLKYSTFVLVFFVFPPSGSFAMAVIEPLLRSAERAFGHVRPPGGFKPGSAQWKAHLQAHVRSQLASPQSTAQSTPKDASRKKLQGVLGSIVEHALTPVFRGLRPTTAEAFGSEAAELASAEARAIARAAQRSYLRKSPAQAWSRAPTRPQLLPYASTADGPGLKLARLREFGSSPFFLVHQAPLGLRAAMDELEKQLRQYGQDEKTGLQLASPTKESPILSESKLKSHQWLVKQMVDEADTMDASREVEDFLFSPNESDFCLSCSSSVRSMPDSDDMSTIYFRTESEDPVRVRTTLTVPLSPDLAGILAANLEPEEGILYENMFVDIGEAWRNYRLRVVTPLDRALHTGHLSTLEPQGWLRGDLLGYGSDGRPYTEITFDNCTQDDVLMELMQDVTPAVFTWLRPMVTEVYLDDDDSTICGFDDGQDGFGDDDDQDSNGDDDQDNNEDDDDQDNGNDDAHNDLNNNRDGAQRSPNFALLGGEYFLDLDVVMNAFGPASIASMEDHGQGVPHHYEPAPAFLLHPGVGHAVVYMQEEVYSDM
jgi:hypothetical protein